MKKRMAGVFLASLVLFDGFSLGEASVRDKWKGTIAVENGVTVVKSPKNPIYQTPALEVREDYVLGGDTAKAGYTFVHPWTMVLDAAENLYVVDAGDANLKVFDKNGKFVKTIGRRGQGPGEFQFPTGACILPGRHELIISDIQRVTALDLAGSFLRQFPIRGLTAGIEADGNGDLVVETTALRSNELTLKVFSPDMSRELGVVLSCRQEPTEDPFKPRPVWTVDQEGRIVFGDAKSYEIRFADSKGRVLKKIVRDYDPVRAAQDEKDDLTARTKQVLGAEAAKSMVFSPHHSAYRSFFAADGGRLFVQTWERIAGGKNDIYDVFDRDGRFVARVPLNPNPDFLNPHTRILKNGKLYTIEPDERGYEVVKRYSVIWNLPGE